MSSIKQQEISVSKMQEDVERLIVEIEKEELSVKKQTEEINNEYEGKNKEIEELYVQWFEEKEKKENKQSNVQYKKAGKKKIEAWGDAKEKEEKRQQLLQQQEEDRKNQIINFKQQLLTDNSIYKQKKIDIISAYLTKISNRKKKLEYQITSQIQEINTKLKQFYHNSLPFQLLFVSQKNGTVCKLCQTKGCSGCLLPASCGQIPKDLFENLQIEMYFKNQEPPVDFTTCIEKNANSKNNQNLSLIHI
eukprot:TRINITY_DN8149_c0_g1_i1.p3 TRINITY_DN8149_c0_g1~~TRINITY_DN8149_c0_g1_i1.p3  ORF type:complete len:248 (-),score=66.13 TRINITY_DN8149_c0_g1_i1:120-863(-)